MFPSGQVPLRIAVVGTGISGLAAAWLLSQRHNVTVYEQEPRTGGHSNTVDVAVPGGTVAVDTGFIVYNPPNYPNLTALFAHLGVATKPSEMSFAVSRCDSALEYAGTSLATLFAQPMNMLKPRFWSMLSDLRRFYREAPRDLAQDAIGNLTLGEYLQQRGYADPFQRDHLLPMAAAIWSAPANSMLDCSAAAFVRFFENHGLLLLQDRPEWRTVCGGSRSYVDRLASGLQESIRRKTRVVSIARTQTGVEVAQADGEKGRFDHVVIATHSDDALSMLQEPSPDERRLLGAIRYRKSRVVLHSDSRLMPKRPSVWSSWNYVHSGPSTAGNAQVTYWMNRLQGLPDGKPLFVTLDPITEPRSPIHAEAYAHPVFDAATHLAQRELWRLQGRRNTWFCGAYFGAGFHEDGLQAGLAVAEQLGGVRRPWNVPNESGRVFLHPPGSPLHLEEVA
jgi:hypothetical protein